MPKKCGFTLLEMAIVILIIGAIVGSIVIGRDLIRDAQLRSSVDEAQFYIQSLHNFKDKYGALPGDFSTATSIWGAAHAVPATCITTVINHLVTCNGDGDGWITDQATAGTHYEQFRAWQQLDLAGMLAYDLTPAANSGGTQDRLVGHNIPPAKLSGAGWGLVGLKANYLISGGTEVLQYITNDVPAKHVLILGGNSISGLYSLAHQTPMLSAPEAKAMDDKIDDGFATTGKLVGMMKAFTNSTTCQTSSFDYNLSAEGNLCTMVFKTGL